MISLYHKNWEEDYLSLFFFHEIMKFYNDICIFFSQIDVICVVKGFRNIDDLLKCTSKLTFSFNFFPLRRANSITWENFVPAKQDPSTARTAVQKRDLALPGWNFSHLWKVYNTARIPTKRDKILFRPTVIM